MANSGGTINISSANNVGSYDLKMGTPNITTIEGNNNGGSVTVESMIYACSSVSSSLSYSSSSSTTFSIYGSDQSGSYEIYVKAYMSNHTLEIVVEGGTNVAGVTSASGTFYLWVNGDWYITVNYTFRTFTQYHWTVRYYNTYRDYTGSNRTQILDEIDEGVTTANSITHYIREYSTPGYTVNSVQYGETFSSLSNTSLGDAVTLRPNANRVEWTDVKYDVYYNSTEHSYTLKENTYSSGWSTTKTVTLKYSQPYTPTAFSNVRGFQAEGWSKTQYSQGSGTASYKFNKSISALTSTNGGTVNIYQVWSRFTYTINLVGLKPVTASSNVAGSMGSTSVVYGVTSTLPENTYTLTGWRYQYWIDSNGTKRADNKQSLATDSVFWDYLFTFANNSTITLNTAWLANTYKVVYNEKLVGQTTNTTANVATYIATYDVEFTLRNAPKSHYSFGKWVNSTTGTEYSAGAKVTNLSSVNDSTVVLVGTYSADSYTIEYVGSVADTCTSTISGSVPSSMRVYYGGTYSLSTTSQTLRGYGFAGWNDAAKGTVAKFTPTQSVTLTDNNSTLANLIIAVGNGKTRKLYTVWAPNKYWVTITNIGDNTDDGWRVVDYIPSYEGSRFQATYDVLYTTPRVRLLGHDFQGWFQGDAQVTQFKNLSTGADVIITGRWVEKKYNIMYYSNQSTPLLQSAEFSYSETIALSTNATLDSNHKLMGWSRTYDRNQYASVGYYLVTDSFSIDADLARYLRDSENDSTTIKFYAVWGILRNIVFNGNGGKLLDGTTATITRKTYIIADTRYLLPSDSLNLYKSSETFLGWVGSASGTTLISYVSLTYSNSVTTTTVYAHWGDIKVYGGILVKENDTQVPVGLNLVSFLSGVSGIPAFAMYVYPNTIIPLPYPGNTISSDGVFRGWEKSGTLYEVGQNYLVTGPTTFTARWVERVTSAYDLGTATVGTAFSKTLGTSLPSRVQVSSSSTPTAAMLSATFRKDSTVVSTIANKQYDGVLANLGYGFNLSLSVQQNGTLAANVYGTPTSNAIGTYTLTLSVTDTTGTAPTQTVTLMLYVQGQQASSFISTKVYIGQATNIPALDTYNKGTDGRGTYYAYPAPEGTAIVLPGGDSAEEFVSSEGDLSAWSIPYNNATAYFPLGTVYTIGTFKGLNSEYALIPFFKDEDVLVVFDYNGGSIITYSAYEQLAYQVPRSQVFFLNGGDNVQLNGYTLCGWKLATAPAGNRYTEYSNDVIFGAGFPLDLTACGDYSVLSANWVVNDANQDNDPTNDLTVVKFISPGNTTYSVTIPRYGTSRVALPYKADFEVDGKYISSWTIRKGSKCKIITDSNMSATTIARWASITPNNEGEIELVANYSAKSYTVKVEYKFNSSTQLLPTYTASITLDGRDTYLLGASTISRTRDGYLYIGWAQDYDLAYNRGVSVYEKQESIVLQDLIRGRIPVGDTYTITLYASWAKIASPYEYELKFNANCGDALSAPSNIIQYSASGSCTFHIPQTVPTRMDKTWVFAGWATSPTSIGPSVAADADLTVSQNTELYAVWFRYKSQLTCYSNGGAQEVFFQDTDYSSVTSRSVILPHEVPRVQDREFKIWSRTSIPYWNEEIENRSDVFYPRESVLLLHYYPVMFEGASEIVLRMSDSGWQVETDAHFDSLYAVWYGGYAAVIYDANGGEGAPAAQVSDKVSDETSHMFTLSSEVPVRPFHTFTGWATSVSASIPAEYYSPGQNVTVEYGDSLYLYALWDYNEKTFIVNSTSASPVSAECEYMGASPYKLTIKSGSITTWRQFEVGKTETVPLNGSGLVISYQVYTYSSINAAKTEIIGLRMLSTPWTVVNMPASGEELSNLSVAANCIEGEKYILRVETIEIGADKAYISSYYYPFTVKPATEEVKIMQTCVLQKYLNYGYRNTSNVLLAGELYLAWSDYEWGQISHISRGFKANLTEIPIMTKNAENRYIIDMGNVETISFTVSHITPTDWKEEDDLSTDFRKWSNAKWITYVKEFFNGWQNNNYDQNGKHVGGFTLKYTPAENDLFPALEKNVFLNGGLNFTYGFGTVKLTISLVVATMGLSSARDKVAIRFKFKQVATLGGNYKTFTKKANRNNPFVFPAIPSGADSSGNWICIKTGRAYMPGERIDYTELAQIISQGASEDFELRTSTAYTRMIVMPVQGEYEFEIPNVFPGSNAIEYTLVGGGGQGGTSTAPGGPAPFFKDWQYVPQWIGGKVGGGGASGEYVRGTIRIAGSTKVDKVKVFARVGRVGSNSSSNGKSESEYQQYRSTYINIGGYAFSAEAGRDAHGPKGGAGTSDESGGKSYAGGSGCDYDKPMDFHDAESSKFYGKDGESGGIGIPGRGMACHGTVYAGSGGGAAPLDLTCNYELVSNMNLGANIEVYDLTKKTASGKRYVSKGGDGGHLQANGVQKSSMDTIDWEGDLKFPTRINLSEAYSSQYGGGGGSYFGGISATPDGSKGASGIIIIKYIAG